MSFHVRATDPPTMAIDVAGIVVLPLSPGHPIHDRTDLVIGRKLDPSTVEYAIVEGTPSTVPVVPPIPDAAVILADVYVPAGAATVTAGAVRSFGWPT